MLAYTITLLLDYMCMIILLVPNMLLKCSGSFQSLTDGYRKAGIKQGPGSIVGDCNVDELRCCLFGTGNCIVIAVNKGVFMNSVLALSKLSFRNSLFQSQSVQSILWTLNPDCR